MFTYSNSSDVGAVILAAGRGSRLGHFALPKVMAPIAGRPIVAYPIDILRALGFTREQICVVVGFRQEAIKMFLKERVSYAVQEELSGTAHAAYVGMRALKNNVKHALVMGGDDSAFYRAETIQNLIARHIDSRSVLTLLTVKTRNPRQLGRIIRHADGLVEIVEKEYLTPEQTLINEVSTGTFLFNREWYEEIFPAMPKMKKLGEYGLPASLIMAQKSGKPYQVIPLQNSMEWFGVNTPEELIEADLRKRQKYEQTFYNRRSVSSIRYFDDIDIS